MFHDTQLDHSANDFDSLFELSEVEVDSQLRSMGVDPDELSQRAVEFVDLAKHEQSTSARSQAGVVRSPMSPTAQASTQ